MVSRTAESRDTIRIVDRADFKSEALIALLPKNFQSIFVCWDCDIAITDSPGPRQKSRNARLILIDNTRFMSCYENVENRIGGCNEKDGKKNFLHDLSVLPRSSCKQQHREKYPGKHVAYGFLSESSGPQSISKSTEEIFPLVVIFPFGIVSARNWRFICFILKYNGKVANDAVGTFDFN